MLTQDLPLAHIENYHNFVCEIMNQTKQYIYEEKNI